jgi:hypothetical protein
MFLKKLSIKFNSYFIPSLKKLATTVFKYKPTGFIAHNQSVKSFSISRIAENFTSSNSSKLNPWFLTGFSDAEGSFIIKIQKNDKLRTKWRVRPVFSITLHKKDLYLLESIQNTLGVGNISQGVKSAIYAVDSVKEIPVILNHFDNYPLVTHKKSDYLLFKQCFNIVEQGGHLNDAGLLKILGLKSSLNLGLSEDLKINFPNIIKTERPDFNFTGIPDGNWVSGFVSGDGSFHIVPRTSEGKSLFLRFSIHLHSRELDVLKGISSYLKLYGSQEINHNYKDNEISISSLPYLEDLEENEKKVTILENSVSLQFSKFSDICDIVIPFFKEYQILGVKNLDFQDFVKVCEILKTKKDLKSQDLWDLAYEEILEIKSGMNLNRK